MVEVDLDLIFCMNAKKYMIPKLLLKAVAEQESAFKVNAYRFEPAYYEWLKKAQPGRWDTRDPHIVSASYGVMQIMYTTAVGLGLPETFNAEDLYNPVINIELGAKLLRTLLNGIEAGNLHVKFGIWPFRIALARYNGGGGGNPNDAGVLRNQSYVDQVFSKWLAWRLKEKDSCYA